MQLYDWQAECLDKWVRNDYKGIVNVVTGAGKTMLALAAIRRLWETAPAESLKVKIIVPKTFLVSQWFYALKDVLDVSRDDVGLFLGTRKDKSERRFMIYVINSARYAFARHMLEDAGFRVLIIADECHHYGSGENARIFDFNKIASGYGKYYALGLSATPNCRSYKEVLVPNLGKEIYRFDFIQALEANIISRFSVLNICLPFSPNERIEYDELTERLSISLRKLKQNCPQLYIANNRGFFAQLENIINTHEAPDIRQLAQTVSLLSFQRKEIVHFAEARITCVVDLVRLIDKKSKIIIFGERIDMADEVYQRLSRFFPGKVGIYHSKMRENVRKTVLRNFEHSEIRILVSCKTLDEGLNVSDTDVGIIMSSTSSERQRIQRLGRVLRKKEDERGAYFYYLYIHDTIEETEVLHDLHDDLIDNINVVDIAYDEIHGKFLNQDYEELVNEVMDIVMEKSWPALKIDELIRNFELGLIACDWLITEDACIMKIKGASSKRERNYFVAMLWLIRARLAKVDDSLCAVSFFPKSIHDIQPFRK